MNDQDHVAALLAEIRDILADRERQYKDHLANAERAYEAQLELSQKYASRQWSFLFVIVFVAVTLALLVVK